MNFGWPSSLPSLLAGFGRRSLLLFVDLAAANFACRALAPPLAPADFTSLAESGFRWVYFAFRLSLSSSSLDSSGECSFEDLNSTRVLSSEVWE
mgnify:CR=1 FL=1